MKGVYIFAGVLVVISSFVFVVMWLAKMGQKMFVAKREREERDTSKTDPGPRSFGDRGRDNGNGMFHDR